MAHVMTVRGPVEPGELGPTLTHEHVFWDAREGWDPSELADPEVGSLPFEARFGGLARWNGSAFRDDLHQSPDTEYDMVAEEVREFVRAGGGCIVEMSNVGLKPSPAGLRVRRRDPARVGVSPGLLSEPARATGAARAWR